MSRAATPIPRRFRSIMAERICVSKKSAAWTSGMPAGPGRDTTRTNGLSLTASPRFGETAAVAALVP
jgi:hypothetical protein